MTTAVVACRTIEDELKAAMARTGTAYPVYWLASGLHDTPKKLLLCLAETMRNAPEKRLLLAMGHCGNSVAGLETREHEVILPAVDDCITLLLGSVERRKQISRDLAAYFLTDGWMRGERNIWAEYRYSAARFGEETAMDILQMMYGHYKTLALLDTGTAPMEPLIDSTRSLASTLHLEQKVVPATLRCLEELLTGPWEAKRFHRFPPGHTVTSNELLVT